MTGSISSELYRQFLLLYPEPFRREFGDEMLVIFEECRGAQGSWRLFADVVLSAAKQQIRYLSTPAPKSAPLYSEIASSPNLARLLAVTFLCAALTAGVLVGEKPKAAESSTVVRSGVLFWFPTPGWGRYCSDAPERTERSASILTGVLVGRKPEAPESWTLVGIACGQYWSDAPDEAESVLAAQAGWRDSPDLTTSGPRRTEGDVK